MILPVGHDQIQDGCQINPHGTLFRHFNIYNFLLDNICFQKKLVSLNIPGGAREAPLSTRLIERLVIRYFQDRSNIDPYILNVCISLFVNPQS